jgi:thiol-disulfide isomerase/thioredoxin
MKSYLILPALFLLCACGPRGGKAASEAPVKREFPKMDVPSMYTDDQERVTWMVGHFWDRFTDTSKVYSCDSLTVNGVPVTEVESQMGLFTTLLGRLPLEVGGPAVARMFDQVEAFQLKYPDSNVFKEVSRLTEHYLYDPNSPVRNEDLYFYYVEKLSTTELLDSTYQMKYAWDARRCAQNRVGTPATDFAFTDTHGHLRTLYGVKADYTVLIFANPGCQACQEITAAMSASPTISALVESGRVKVVDVYIDQEIDDWKAHIADYPADWINGYDHLYRIRTELIYNIRGIPSIYLLDKDKTVLMKDAPDDIVLRALENL